MALRSECLAATPGICSPCPHTQSGRLALSCRGRHARQHTSGVNAQGAASLPAASSPSRTGVGSRRKSLHAPVVTRRSALRPSRSRLPRAVVGSSSSGSEFPRCARLDAPHPHKEAPMRKPGTASSPNRRLRAVSMPELQVETDQEDLVTERTIEEAERDMGVSMSSAEYNQRMKRAMANPYEYHHHLGMYYTRILPKLIVGSQPQSPDDVSRLHHEEGVEVILNLQQDHDIAYWGIDIHPIQERCRDHSMRHYRRPAVDFDPHSLRSHLPRMVSVIEHNVSEGRTVYVHCTAGLGRAPASAIAYLFWFQNMDLKCAYDFLTSKRPCGPKWDAIRGATYDLAKDCSHKIPLEHLPHCAFSDISQWERDVIQLRVRQLYHH